MKKQALLFMLISFFAFMQPLLGQDRPTNEERLIRLEEGVKNLNIRFDEMNKRFDDLRSDMNKRFESIDKRFESIDKRFDALQGFMLWGFGITFSGMFILIGFILWDRRTTLAPVVNETKELKEIIDLLKKDDRVLKTILKEYAKENEAFAKIMNKAAML